MIKQFFLDKSLKGFFIFSILGLSFSLSLILVTLGLMNGFEWYFKKNLENNLGNFFFKDHLPELNFVHKNDQISFFQIPGFISFEGQGKGILLKAVNEEYFKFFNIPQNNIADNTVLIGKSLKKYLHLKDNSKIKISFKSEYFQELECDIGGYVDHDLYDHDLRFVYISADFLKKYIQHYEHNFLVVKGLEYEEMFIKNGIPYKESWKEFGNLLKAVETQKYSIVMIFQVIVLVAFFNILSFQLFLKQKKNKDFFLLYFLGFSLKSFKKLWFTISFYMFLFSSFFAICITGFIDFLMKNFDFMSLSGKIYYLKKFFLKFYPKEVLAVFLISFFFMMIITFIQTLQFKNTTFAQLRKEFFQ